MSLLQRRPVVRAAVVGGAAYNLGEQAQSGEDPDAGQDSHVRDSQPADPHPEPESGGAMSEAAIDELEKLGELHDQGVLTDVEFEVRKQNLLQNP